MTAIDIYANSDVEKGKLGAAVNVHGNKTVVAISSFEITSEAEANSVIRLFPDLNPCLIPIDIKILNASAGAGELALGLYEGDKGNAIDDDCFATGIDISAENAKGSEIDGLGNLEVAKYGKQLFEIAGHTIANRKDTYDIVATVKTVPSTSAIITVVGTFVQG